MHQVIKYCTVFHSITQQLAVYGSHDIHYSTSHRNKQSIRQQSVKLKSSEHTRKDNLIEQYTITSKNIVH